MSSFFFFLDILKAEKKEKWNIFCRWTYQADVRAAHGASVGISSSYQIIIKRKKNQLHASRKVKMTLRDGERRPGIDSRV